MRRRLLGAITAAGLTAALPLASPSAAPTVTAASVSSADLAPAAGGADTNTRALGFAGSLPTAAQSQANDAAAAHAALARAAAARASRNQERVRLAAARNAQRVTAQRAAANRPVALRAAASRAAVAHAAHRSLLAARAEASAKRRAALSARSPGDVAVAWARKMLGRPYEWGATGPSSFDCSGLTAYVWGKAGVWLTHFSGAQFGEGRRINRGDLRAGDLVFFGGDVHHVGIYIGGGTMISAPHSGDVVREQSIDRSDYVGAVRPG